MPRARGLSHDIRLFGDLYDTVRQSVRDEAEKYWFEIEQGIAVAPFLMSWLDDLDAAFFARFNDWTRPPQSKKLEPYWSQFYSPPAFTTTHQLWPFRLAALVFLHISFDLPMVVSDKVDPAINGRPLQRGIFAAVSPAFARAFSDVGRQGTLGTLVRWISRCAGSAVVFRTISQWVLALRGAAWTYGESIKDQGGAVQLAETKLLEAVTKAAKDTLDEHPWLPWPIDPPRYLSFGLVLAIVTTPIELFTIQALVLGLFVLVGQLFARRLWYRQLARSIDRFGRALYEELSHPARSEPTR